MKKQTLKSTRPPCKGMVGPPGRNTQTNNSLLSFKHFFSVLIVLFFGSWPIVGHGQTVLSESTVLSAKEIEKPQLFLVWNNGSDPVKVLPVDFDRLSELVESGAFSTGFENALGARLETKASLLPLNIGPLYRQERGMMFLMLLLTVAFGYGLYQNRIFQLRKNAELMAALEKLEASAGQSLSADHIAEKWERIQAQKTQKIALTTQEGMSFIKLEDVVRLESSGSYTWFHTSNGEKIMVSQNIKSFEEILPAEHFFRLHQSHIVNLQYVQQLLREDGNCYTLTEDKAKIPVSRRKKDAFLQLLEGQVLG